MAVKRTSLMLKSLHSSISPILKLQPYHSSRSYTNLVGLANRSFVRSSYGFVSHNYFHRDIKAPGNLGIASFNIFADKAKPITVFSPTSLNLSFRNTNLFASVSPLLSHRFHSSSAGKAKDGDLNVSVASGGSDVGASNSDVMENDWIVKVKGVWQSAVDAATYAGQRAKEASDELDPYVQQLFDPHPYLKDVVFPVGYTLIGTILAWVVMPRLLRTFHKYATQTPATLLSRSVSREHIPYDKSFWGALEDPVRYLVTFMAFVQISIMVAPTTIASQYIAQTWRGAVIISFVWFLHRWKTNVISRVLAAQSLTGVDREKMLTLDRISSIGLFVIGIMALAEACGVAVQSILTVGGIGGVATAFAARDILGNVLSGFSMQFSKPFSLGDTIKAGSVEGQVVEMGLTTTSLLSAEKFPVIVPNTLISSQIIVNKSRAKWRAMVSKIPLKLDGLDKIPQISNDINNMLKSHPKVFLGREVPYCCLSRIESSFAEMTLGYNLPHMSKDELYAADQDILLQAVQIIKEHGAEIGSNWSS